MQIFYALFTMVSYTFVNGKSSNVLRVKILYFRKARKNLGLNFVDASTWLDNSRANKIGFKKLEIQAFLPGF